jgi:hypothetical protein
MARRDGVGRNSDIRYASTRRAEKRSGFRRSPERHTPIVPDYRRNRVPGGTFFFTANLLDRRSDLVVTQIDEKREAVRQVRARAPFHIDTCVVFPDHIRCLWTPVFTGAGYCRKAMLISRAVGTRSRKGFRNPYASVNRDHRS